LNSTKPNSVLNVHVAGESTKIGDTAQISLPHTIAPGPVKNEDYGLDLSRRFLPDRVVKNAEDVCKFLRQRNSSQATGPATRAVKQNKLILALPGLLKQASDSTMDDSAFASYLNKLQTEFTIRMDITTDDDAQEGPSGKDIDQTVDLPTLEKPSEEELDEWKKKSDAAENRVMHANMAQSQDKKRPASASGDNDCLPKRSKTEAGAESTVSQPTPINRGSMIEELRRGACTPTTRAATPSSVTTDNPEPQADSVMNDAPAREDTPAEASGSTGARQRAVSISSGSNYDEDMPDVDETSPRAPDRPSPDAYSNLAQPLEQFQPLREWYAREQQTAGTSSMESEERSTPRSLARSRSATQEFLRGLHEDEGEESA
jgi:DNA mismatch repair protein MSH4